jgi:hypothetical protein
MTYSSEKTLTLIHEARHVAPVSNAGPVHDGFYEFIHSDKQVTGYLIMEGGVPGPVRSFFRQKIKEFIKGDFINIEKPDDIYVE